MRYETDVSKNLLNFVIDNFEISINRSAIDNFNKRSSVTDRGGRPYSYSPAEIKEMMIEYFRNCANNGQPFMITGLCMHIGISREWFYRTEKTSNSVFVDTIKKGKYMIEFYWEMQGHLMENPSWAIFVLKNMGWSDKVMISKKPCSNLSDKEKLEAMQRVMNFSEII